MHLLQSPEPQDLPCWDRDSGELDRGQEQRGIAAGMVAPDQEVYC